MRLLLLLTVFAGVLHLGFSDDTVVTVDTLDLPKYTGRWFEYYVSLIPKTTFEKDAVCTFADYTLLPDGTIQAVNHGRILTPKGKARNITGIAFVPDSAHPGKLVVRFPGAKGDGKYWVIRLGPVNTNGLYDYTVITNPRKELLWVLVRDLDQFPAKYDTEVKTFLSNNGFTSVVNKPLLSRQPKSCTYP